MWKIVAVLLLIIILLYLKSFLFLNNKSNSPEEVILPGSKKKKALIIYQLSKHNTSKNAAMVISQELNKLGYSVTMNHPSNNLTYNLEDYELLVFGSAAYMGSPSKALLDYIKDNLFLHKKVLIYVTGLVPDDQRELEEIKEIIPKGNEIASIKISKNEEEKLKNFIKKHCN